MSLPMKHPPPATATTSPLHDTTTASSSSSPPQSMPAAMAEPATQPAPSLETKPTSTSMSTSTPSASAPESLASTNDDDNLPPTKIKRKYLCKMCLHQTWNPREHFRHRITYHNQKIRVVKCPLCVYACQYRQKLNRHLKLVHHLLPHELPKRFELAQTRSSSSSSRQLSNNHNYTAPQGSPYSSPLLPQHLNLDEINSYYSRLVPVKLNSSPLDLSFPEEVKQSIKILEYIFTLCLYGGCEILDNMPL